jgi:hypothetical protein
MMSPVPLADDWLYWDPLAMHTYPHSRAPRALARKPEQLELFACTHQGTHRGRGGCVRRRAETGSAPRRRGSRCGRT